jgi:hypothetical protein
MTRQKQKGDGSPEIADRSCHREERSNVAIRACHHEERSDVVIRACHHEERSDVVIRACHHEERSDVVISKKDSYLGDFHVITLCVMARDDFVGLLRSLRSFATTRKSATSQFYWTINQRPSRFSRTPVQRVFSQFAGRPFHFADEISRAFFDGADLGFGFGRELGLGPIDFDRTQRYSQSLKGRNYFRLTLTRK